MTNINNFTSIDTHIIPLLTIVNAMKEYNGIGIIIVNNSPKSMNCLMDNDDGLNCE